MTTQYDNFITSGDMLTQSDEYITRDMLTNESYEGNYFFRDNAVMYDLRNGNTNIVCFCSDKSIAEGVAQGLNLLDNLEADGIALKKILYNRDTQTTSYKNR